ncbi:spermine/spermidine synthase domain containing protein [Nitzschia inconspicua]|uniref:Spermine/spermidine synthase domain containing protein n=1 Tax=Nitzschia inconspicua TaxID=303405 RepID=A0A9K3K987_9STRA|nr:spermine/spermidine synthase domain containing protein [Nitzschia inconspicua]
MAIQSRQGFRTLVGILAFILSFSSLSLPKTFAAEEVVDTHLEEARAIFEWVNTSEGGFVSPKQDVRRLVPGDLSTPLIVYAKERINRGEQILRVPWSSLIESDDPDDAGQLPCGTIRAVAREMKLGDKSKYAPYAKYLIGEADNQIPSGWSKPAKKLLDDIVGDDTIPPTRPTDWVDRWRKRCKGDPKDKIAAKAALLIIQRSDDAIMIPAYDAYNHRNGKWTNTKTVEEEGVAHVTSAIKTIEEGEEIFISYNFCEECGGRKNFYGTAEILRDYGFVERMPQRWHYFMPTHYQFDLDEDDNGDISLKWHSKHRPKSEEKMERAMMWIGRQIRRLRRIKNIDWNFGFEDKDHGMTKYEWDTIWEFVDANIAALTKAHESLSAKLLDEEQIQEQTCVAYESGGFDLLEKTQSAYQLVKFKEKQSTNDVCMNLDKIIQICANYRPHYHEYITHGAGRFVEDVRRIIFIGGGDSMLLHEALKYPNMELVVGLELDQTVTRKCFKYFNTLPHFDDERVEWWFGDATKSLLLLPEDYWGSFDLVLVDLSETVMSLSVTDELDVFDALSLLLNPKHGVLVKNEVYLEKLSEVFDYTMELYYDSPVICSQTVALGSNSVNFFHAPTYNHGLQNFLYDDMHSPDTHLDLMHDFRRNIVPREKCQDNKEEEISNEQARSAGIMEIVNAEKIGVNIDKGVLAVLTTVVEKGGFTLLGDPFFEDAFGFLLMKEGYIAVRLWPEEKYIGLDINLWGRTYEIKNLKTAIVKALESEKMYSYKVVVGGMFGSNTWKEDLKIIGPKMKQLRNCEEDIVLTGSLDWKFASSVSAEEIIPVTMTDTVVAIVFCGLESTECPVFDGLKAKEEVKTLVRINECESLENGTMKDAFACEKSILDTMKGTTTDQGMKFNLIVLDGAASYKTHQIVSSILDTETNRDLFLEYHCVAMTWSSDLYGETWRREFLDRFRKQIHHDPVSRAEIVFQAGGKSYELGVVSTQNRRANYAFEKLEKRLKDRLSDSGAKIELRWIHGGLFNYIEDFKTREFKHEDYDNKPGRDQFASQVPLGSQYIYQLTPPEEDTEESLILRMFKIVEYLEAAFKGIKNEKVTIKQFTGVGDGGVLLAASPMANAIVVWDGRDHIDVNLFMFLESSNEAKSFIDAFVQAARNQLVVSLRDDQPRGVGGVVNFKSDIEGKAEAVEEEE